MLASTRAGVSFQHSDLPEQVNAVAAAVVDAAYEVRNEMGAGLRERIYKDCLESELADRGHGVEREVRHPVLYKGRPLGIGAVADLWIDRAVVVEAEATDALSGAHVAQVLTYLRLSGSPVGILVNFNAVPFRTGVRRFVLSEPNPPVRVVASSRPDPHDAPEEG